MSTHLIPQNDSTAVLRRNSDEPSTRRRVHRREPLDTYIPQPLDGSTANTSPERYAADKERTRRKKKPVMKKQSTLFLFWWKIIIFFF